MKLYEITKQFQSVFEALEENGGEITDELQAQLSIAEENLHEKCDNICGYIKELEGHIENINTEVQRLTARKKATENTIQSLKNYVFFEMRKSKMDKIETSLFKLRIGKTKSAVVIDDFKQVPVEFTNFTVKGTLNSPSISAEFFNQMQNVFGDGIELTPDKKALYDALTQGEVTGAHLEQRETLFIK